MFQYSSQLQRDRVRGVGGSGWVIVPAAVVLCKIATIINGDAHPLPYPYRNIRQKAVVHQDEYKLEVSQGSATSSTFPTVAHVSFDKEAVISSDVVREERKRKSDLGFEGLVFKLNTPVWRCVVLCNGTHNEGVKDLLEPAINRSRTGFGRCQIKHASCCHCF